MNFKDYQSQIKELISLRHAPDLNNILDNLFFGESKSDKFLIKMEITRLAKPCQRIIDLRDKTTDECQLFEQGNLKHYLTAETIKILKENIDLYGIYTIGVFEAVHSHVLNKKEKQNKPLSPKKPTKSKNQCPLIQLTEKNKRAAPRMYLVSSITLILPDGNTIQAQTSDISSTGIKIKLKEDIHIMNQEVIQIIFTDLQMEYRDTIEKNKIYYQIVKQTIEDNTHYLYLMYGDDNEQFISFIKKFISKNQYKYKIDVHYYYELAQIHAIKNRYIEQMNTLPIYLNNRSSTPFLFALKNQANKKILDDWCCNDFNQLPILFSELRLTKLLANSAKKQATTLYCFTHQSNGKNYFLSATEEELIEKGLKNLFINYGSSKNSWRIYHLNITPYQYQETQDYDITDARPTQFSSVTHVATLQPLAHLPAFFTDNVIDSRDLNQINQFIHQDGKIHKATIFSLCSKEQRKEERYSYTSKLSLSIDGKQYNGELIDFSLSGLKIRLEKITSIAPSSNVLINLLALQNISEKYSLSQLQYKVVRNGAKNILHLQVSNSDTLDICHAFFSLLIQNNPTHFQCAELKSKKQPTSKRLIEISEEAFVDCVFFIGKESGQPKIKFAAIDKIDHPLISLFSMYSDNKYQLNYTPILNNKLFKRLLAQPFKESKKGALYQEVIIYIKAYQNSEKKWRIYSFLDSDFKSKDEKVEFITRTNKEAIFYALNYRLSGLQPVNLEGIKTEIDIISRFAMHLTKKLEEQLHDITAMIEIIDRTATILQAIDH